MLRVLIALAEAQNLLPATAREFRSLRSTTFTYLCAPLASPAKPASHRWAYLTACPKTCSPTRRALSHRSTGDARPSRVQWYGVFGGPPPQEAQLSGRVSRSRVRSAERGNEPIPPRLSRSPRR